MRRAYARVGIDEESAAGDPLEQFSRWFDDAVAVGLPEPNAMVLATASQDGVPGARTVLLKGVDARGFVFYTNTASSKAQDLAANPRAALVFPWHMLQRQVRVTGTVAALERSEVQAYFASRPRGSQLGAWASPQSQVIGSRSELDERFAEAAGRWPVGSEVPLPDFWGGFRVVPDVLEFWAGRDDRLHDRLRYRRGAGDGGGPSWLLERLAP